jgi:hypothetical protein
LSLHTGAAAMLRPLRIFPLNTLQKRRYFNLLQRKQRKAKQEVSISTFEVLSTDDGEMLIDDDEQVMETY